MTTARRFLFATMPFDGHFKPLTGIAVRLMELGHDVSWYAGASYADSLRRLGIPHHPFDRAREVNGENIGDLFPERARLSGPKLIAFEFENVFVANVEGHFRDIAALHEEHAFDALVADEGLYAIKLIAEKLRIPVYAVGVSPLMFNSRDAPPNFFGLKPARTPVGRARHRVIDAMVNHTMKPGAERFNALLAAEGLEPLAAPRDFFDIPARASKLFLQSGVPGFEYPRSDLPANVRFVGPLLPHRRAAAGPSLPDRVRGAGSVVVVSQGTVDNKDPEKLIAPTLEALRDSEHLVVATTGGANTQPLRERFPAAVVEDFVDFGALLPHASLMVCNGGYGSIMLALTAGVPVVSAGTREGKNDINARIDHFGLGVDLRTETPKPARIARAVERVLSEPRYRENVDRLRAEFAGYDPLALVVGFLLRGAVQQSQKLTPYIPRARG